MEQGKGLKQGKFFFAIFLFLLFIMDMAANLMGSDIEDDALQDSGGGEHSKASGGGESSTSRSFYRPQVLQVFTSYKDVIPESEKKGWNNYCAACCSEWSRILDRRLFKIGTWTDSESY